MAIKLKPCTVGPKHSWTFKKNVTLKSVRITPKGTIAHIRYRGLYRCACGEQKYGREGDVLAVTKREVA